ncbi:MAG: DJ-1/PfpI family protein [bacterium]
MSAKKNILFILIPDFRDEEFTVPFNILYEAGHTIDVAGLKEGEIIGANGYKHKADFLLDTLSHEDLEKYDVLVIPGGPGSTTYLWNNPKIQEIIEFFNERGKIVATICYACVAAAQSGILKGKKATVYPTHEARKIFEECEVTFDDAGVVTLKDEKIITAQGPKFAEEFGTAILDMLNQ